MGAVPCKTSGDADSGSSFDVLDSVPVRFANEPRCLSLALLLQAFIMVCQHTPNREGSMKEDANPLKRIEHIVVVMLENRSFDSLLGWLYDSANEAPFDIVPSDFEGLSGKRLSNPDVSGKEVPAGKTLDPRSPQPNPGEPFEDVYSQIYDVPLMPFSEVPAVPTKAATMRGFIRNYADQKHRPIDPSSIMQSLTPQTVPVLAALAHNFALCDHWFASIPTQTFCNRSFVHAGTSSGYVNNNGGGLCFVNETPTIFDLLEEAGRTWQVFAGGWLLQSFTLLTQKSMRKYAFTKHFAHFNDFLRAAGRSNGLPNLLVHRTRLFRFHGLGARKRHAPGVQSLRVLRSVKSASGRGAARDGLQRTSQEPGLGKHASGNHLRRARRLLRSRVPANFRQL